MSAGGVDPLELLVQIEETGIEQLTAAADSLAMLRGQVTGLTDANLTLDEAIARVDEVLASLVTSAEAAGIAFGGARNAEAEFAASADVAATAAQQEAAAVVAAAREAAAAFDARSAEQEAYFASIPQAISETVAETEALLAQTDALITQTAQLSMEVAGSIANVSASTASLAGELNASTDPAIAELNFTLAQSDSLLIETAGLMAEMGLASRDAAAALAEANAAAYSEESALAAAAFSQESFNAAMVESATAASEAGVAIGATGGTLAYLTEVTGSLEAALGPLAATQTLAAQSAAELADAELAGAAAGEADAASQGRLAASLNASASSAGIASGRHFGLIGYLTDSSHAATVLTAAVVIADAAIVKLGADTQTEMLQAANNTGLATDQIGQMQDTIMHLSSTTGQSFDTLTQGFMHAMNLSQNLTASTAELTVANQAAIATAANVADTTNLEAQVMHEYGLDVANAGTQTEQFAQIQDNAARTMGIMLLAANQANETLSQFADSSGRAIATAANLGVPLEQVAAALATLSRHGQDANQAQTSFIDIMTHMIHPAKQQEEELQRISQLTGVDLVGDFSAAGVQAKGLTGILGDLRTAYQILGYSQADAYGETMKLMNAQRGGIPLAILLGSGAQDYQVILGNLSDTQKTATVVQDDYARSTDTLGHKTSVAVHTVGAALRTSGENQANFWNGAIDGVGKYAGAILGLGAGAQTLLDRLDPLNTAQDRFAQEQSSVATQILQHEQALATLAEQQSVSATNLEHLRAVNEQYASALPTATAEEYAQVAAFGAQQVAIQAVNSTLDNLHNTYESGLGLIKVYSGAISEYGSQEKAITDAVGVLQERQKQGLPLSAQENELLANQNMLLGRLSGGVADDTIKAGLAAAANVELMKAQDALNAVVSQGISQGPQYDAALQKVQEATANAKQYGIDPADNAASQFNSGLAGLQGTIVGSLVPAIMTLDADLRNLKSPPPIEIQVADQAAVAEINRLRGMIESGAIMPVSLGTPGQTKYASGTGPGGAPHTMIATVNEAGPELIAYAGHYAAGGFVGIANGGAEGNVLLPQGAQVFPADQTAAMLGGGGSNWSGLFAGLPAAADAAGLQAAQLLDDYFPHSPAKKGPLSSFPSWKTIYADLNPEAAIAGDTAAKTLHGRVTKPAVTYDWTDLFAGIPDAATATASQIAKSLDDGVAAGALTASDAATHVTTGVLTELGKLYDSYMVQIDQLSLSGAKDAGKEIDALKTKMSAITEIMTAWSTQTGMTVAEALAADQHAQDILTGWKDLSGQLGQVFSGALVPKLQADVTQMQEFLQLAVSELAPASIVNGLRSGLAAKETELEEAGKLYGDAIAKGIVTDPAVLKAGQDFADVMGKMLSSSDPGKTLKDYQEAAKKAAEAYQLGLEENLPAAVVKSLKDAADKAQAEATDAGKILSDATTDGYIKGLPALDAATLAQIKQIESQLTANGQQMGSSTASSLTDALVAGLENGRVTVQQASSLFTQPMIDDLKKLETEAEANLADALIKGTDPTIPEHNLQIIDAMLKQLGQDADAAAYSVGKAVSEVVSSLPKGAVLDPSWLQHAAGGPGPTGGTNPLLQYQADQQRAQQTGSGPIVMTVDGRVLGTVSMNQQFRANVNRVSMGGSTL